MDAANPAQQGEHTDHAHPESNGGDAPVLAWSIKASLLGYVRAMDDGSIVAEEPAKEVGNAYVFMPDPAAPAGALHFLGGVTITGHGGMLRLEVREPRLERAGDTGWQITIADPHEPGARLPLASVAALEEAHGHPGVTLASGTKLTEDGADLFLAGPYTAGTPLDDPELHPASAIA